MSAAAIDAIRRWRADPATFVRQVFKAEPDAWQVDVLRAFPTHQRIAMQACKGPGKSCVLAWLVWNFLLTRLHPKVVCTSITGDNLADGLWTELANWQGRSEILSSAFTWTKTRITSNQNPETWWASARQWSKGADPKTLGETLAGIHADNVLFVIDEAGGVPDAVAAAAEAGLANVIDPAKQDAHLLIAGNPYALEGPLYRASTNERPLWHLTQITADPDDPKRTPRVSPDWARQQIAKYGRDDPWVLVNVLGKFPPAAFNALVGPDEVNAAIGRHAAEETFRHAPKILGVDVARQGGDRTVLFPRQGIVAHSPVIMRGADSRAVAARILVAAEKWRPDAIFIDGSGGYGAGVVDALRDSSLPIHEIQFAGKPIDERFLNKRAEIWFKMAEWIKAGACLPPEQTELVAELTAPTYTHQRDRLQLEAKDQIAERIGRSPDLADALALTFSQPVIAGELGGPSVGRVATTSTPRL